MKYESSLVLGAVAWYFSTAAVLIADRALSTHVLYAPNPAKGAAVIALFLWLVIPLLMIYGSHRVSNKNTSDRGESQ